VPVVLEHLVAGDTNGRGDVFVHDLDLDTTELASLGVGCVTRSALEGARTRSIRSGIRPGSSPGGIQRSAACLCRSLPSLAPGAASNGPGFAHETSVRRAEASPLDGYPNLR
jgi:hypothetical protein